MANCLERYFFTFYFHFCRFSAFFLWIGNNLSNLCCNFLRVKKRARKNNRFFTFTRIPVTFFSQSFKSQYCRMATNYFEGCFYELSISLSKINVFRDICSMEIQYYTSRAYRSEHVTHDFDE